MHILIYVNDTNYGYKNANTNTVSSELILNVYLGSGQGKLRKAVSMVISSDGGRIQIDTILKKGSFIYDEPGYFKQGRTFFCFKSENQIEEVKKILESNNVSIKVHFEEGEDYTYVFQQSQREDWLKVIRFYEDLNEYVNNIPAE